MSENTGSPASGLPTNFVNVNNGNKPTIYVEGVSNMFIGFPNSKIVFFEGAERHSNGDITTDVRNVACTLVMPTSMLIELAQLSLTNVVNNKATLADLQRQWNGNLTHQFDNMGPLPPTATQTGTL